VKHHPKTYKEGKYGKLWAVGSETSTLSIVGGNLELYHLEGLQTCGDE
jgi:hypothetical protein